MRNILGIVNLHDAPHLSRLTGKRSLGAVTFLGRYGIMDFALSNFSNSEIDQVAVLIDNYFHSIRNHVSNGTVWINNTRTGFQRLLFNEKSFSSQKFNTDINNIYSNRALINDINYDYVVIASPIFLSSMDFRPLIEKHILSGKDISIIYKHVDNAKDEYINCDSLCISDGLVEGIELNAGLNSEADISLETFVINRDIFEKIIEMSREVSSLFGIRQMIEYSISHKLFNVNAVPFDGFVVPMLSFENYVKYSFELLNYETRCKLFIEEWPIYTTTHNTPPTLYGENANVTNSFIANGSIVKGTVKNSVISRDVIIEEGAVVENCILFTKTKVSKNTKLKYVVTDKNVKIINSKDVHGSKDNVMFVDFGEII